MYPVLFYEYVCVSVCNRKVWWKTVAMECLTCEYNSIYYLWFPLRIYSVLSPVPGLISLHLLPVNVLRNTLPLTPPIVSSMSVSRYF